MILRLFRIPMVIKRNESEYEANFKKERSGRGQKLRERERGVKQ